MNEFLDIYTRLIIGVLTFIAPMIVFLLSFYSKGVATYKRRGEIEKQQIVELIKAEVNVPDFNPKSLTKGNKSLAKQQKRIKSTINLLTPTRQIIRIFGSFFLSLLCVMIFKILKDPRLDLNNRYCTQGLIILSLSLFIHGILCLWQVARTAITTKYMIDEQDEQESVKTDDSTKPEKKA